MNYRKGLLNNISEKESRFSQLALVEEMEIIDWDDTSK